jgi:monoamine oxidase
MTAFDRRAVLGGAAASAFSRRAAFGAVFDTDVVVVGAGAAGLAAAHELKRLKHDFVVLESSGRTGGRLVTETAFGAPYDAGGLYIHWADRNPWTDIARDLGVATQPDASRGPFRFFDKGAEQPPSLRGARRAAFQRLSALLEGDDVADVSIAEAARRADPDLADAAEGLARLAVGEEPQRISARDYARLWSGDDLLVPSGYGALAQRWGAAIAVRTKTRVTGVDWSGQGVTVATGAGVVRARAVVITVSVGVLKSGAIRFTPELPASTREALDGLAMGALSKVGLSFDFSKLDLPPGDIFTREVGGGAFNFDCRPFGRELVVAVFGGDFARDVAGSDEGAIATALDAFVRVAGGSARTAFRAGRAHAWFRDPDALGCYSHCLPGRADARERLAEPIGDRIFVAGEATGLIGGAMTAGGAALSGCAAAATVKIPGSP